MSTPKTSTEDYFWVETSRDGKSWDTNDDGPHVLYHIPAETVAGIEWANKLATVYRHVRIRRVRETVQPIPNPDDMDGRAPEEWLV